MYEKSVFKREFCSGKGCKRRYTMFFIIFDLGMAICFFAFGLWFYKSGGSASNYLTGYNQKSNDRMDDKEMCKIYGKRMMCWGIPFSVGAIIDAFTAGIGCTLAWIVWISLFIWHIIDRRKREDRND